MIKNDHELVTEAKNGSEEAMILLYNNYFSLIFGYFKKTVSDHESAQDLTSETFLRMVRKLSTFQGESSFKNWLFGIAKIVLLTFLKEKYSHSHEELNENITEKIEENFPNEESNELAIKQLKKILNKLKPKYRHVLESRFLLGLTIKETAEKLSLSEDNIKVLQHRALKKANKLCVTSQLL